MDLKAFIDTLGGKPVGVFGLGLSGLSVVVNDPYVFFPGARIPNVPSDAAFSIPASVQSCCVKDTVDVLPLVPVTATMVFGCCP